MRAPISEKNQINLWGKSATEGLDPHRVDLWYLDMKPVVDNINRLGLRYEIPPIFPQYAQSVTIPELKMKADPIRRGNVPFNMPSWDEPLDAMRITFLMPVNQNYGISPTNDTLAFLTTWHELVRAGRGSRVHGGLTGWYAETLALRPKGSRTPYGYPFRFNFEVYLLKPADVNDVNLTPQALAVQNQQALVARQTQQRYAESLKGVDMASIEASSRERLEASVSAPRTLTSIASFGALEQSMSYVVKQAWLAGFKVGDLTYKESGPLTCEATFYAESIHQDLTVVQRA